MRVPDLANLAARGALALALLAAAPVPAALAQAGAQTRQPLAIMHARDVAPDVRLALTAAIAPAYGLAPGSLRGVTFAPGEADKLSEPGFAYRGFFPYLGVSDLAPVTGNEGLFDLTGTVNFVDEIGRRTAAFYALRYRVAAPGRLAIERANMRPVSPEVPLVHLFVAPAAVGDEAVAQGRTGFAALYGAISARALPLAAGGTVPRGEQEFGVFMFAMDRMAPDARFEMRLSASRNDDGGSTAGVELRNDQGWHFATFRGRFALDAARPFYAKAIYAPGREAAQDAQRPRMAGVFALQAKR